MDPEAPEFRVTSKYTFALKLAIRAPVTSLVRFIATESTPPATSCPDLAILDPGLTAGLPPPLTAATARTLIREECQPW
jgi:hypothetical protein